MTMLEVEFFGKEISPIIECLNVEFKTGIFVWCYNRGNDAKSSTLDSNERDGSAEMIARGGRHIQ